MTSVHSSCDTRIFYKQCRTLVEAGYEVVLIAQHHTDETCEGVHIKAVSPPRNRLERMFRTTLAVLTKALREGRDTVYHLHDPELIPVGILLRLLGRKVVYDVHEDVPKQVLGKGWIPYCLRGIVGRGVDLVERMGAGLFSGISAATPVIASRFPPNKTVLVQNSPILGELVISQPVPYLERPPWLAYVGGITTKRGIREMISALERLPADLGARLRMAGRFMPGNLEHEVGVMPGWKCVDYLGWQSRQQVAALLGMARIGLVVLHPCVNYVEARPVKLFEYMSAGLPVVASDFPLWRDIIGRTGCGLLVDPLDVDAIAEAIHYLLTHPFEAKEMGVRGQQAVRDTYNWGVEAERLLSLYGSLTQD